VQEIKAGKYTKELETLMKSDEKALRKLYDSRDIEPE